MDAPDRCPITAARTAAGNAPFIDELNHATVLSATRTPALDRRNQHTVTQIRAAWADQVGEASTCVVELAVEAFLPRYRDPPCQVRGTVSVAGPPASEAEQLHLAGILVGQTPLPALRPNMALRMVSCSSTELDTPSSVLAVTELRMPRFMSWEKDYMENPYLRALPMKELNQRFHDILTTSHEITQDGKLGLQLGADRIEWMKYLQHVCAEAKTRELPFPLFLDMRHAPAPEDDSVIAAVKGDHSRRAATAVATWLSEGNKDIRIVKYGEHRYMKRFVATGEMLIQNSTDFDRDSYNQALRDDENTISVFGVRTADGMAIPAHDAPGWSSQYGMQTYFSTTDRDYMLYCMSCTLSPTLFAHFGQSYDSCVLIHDPEEFIRRVGEGTSAAFPPGDFVLAHSRITYIDPLGAIPPLPPIPEGSTLSIPFLKHFRHAYQDEFRFVWFPQTSTRRESPQRTVRTGCLQDIAEVVRI